MLLCRTMGGFGLSHVVLFLSILCICLFLGLIYYVLMLRSINQQLSTWKEDSNIVPIQQSFNTIQLKRLVGNINRCLAIHQKHMDKVKRHKSEINQLISSLSHDLRMPLNALRNCLEVLGTADLNEKEREILENAWKNGVTFSQLINHFFEFTYVMDVMPEFHLSRFNLTDIIVEEIEEIKKNCRNIDLEILLEEKKDVFARVDPDITKRILDNIVLYTTAFTKRTINIKIVESDMINIRIINEEELSKQLDATKVFDRFYTIDSLIQPNSRLGLSSVRLLTERMGGKAMARIEEGHFEIVISLQRV